MAHSHRRNNEDNTDNKSVARRFSVLDLLFSRVTLVGIIVALACQLYMQNLHSQFPDGLPDGDRGRLARHHVGLQLINVKAALRTYLYNITYVEAYRDETERAAEQEAAQIINSTTTNFIVEEAHWDGVRVLMLKPRNGAIRKRKAIFYIHGGGFVFTSPEYNIQIAVELVERTGALIIMPSYRLAPEHPWPAGMNDCVIAISYAMQHASELGVDAERILVTGASAGANLASVAVMKITRSFAVEKNDCDCRENVDAEVHLTQADETAKAPPVAVEQHSVSISSKSKAGGDACSSKAGCPVVLPPAKQILIYPGLQSCSFRTTSYLRATNDPFSNSWSNAFVVFLYTGSYRRVNAALSHQISCYSKQNGAGSNPVMQRYIEMFSDSSSAEQLPEGCVIPSAVSDSERNPYVSILSTPDSLSDLPYTVIYTTEADGLRDDGIMFYARLRDEGVRAKLKNFLCVHGALQMFQWLKCGQQMMDHFVEEVDKDDYY